MLKLLEMFMEDQTDDDAVPVQKKLSSQNGTQEENLLAKDKPPSAETGAEGGPDNSKPKGDHNFFVSRSIRIVMNAG